LEGLELIIYLLLGEHRYKETNLLFKLLHLFISASGCDQGCILTPLKQGAQAWQVFQAQHMPAFPGAVLWLLHKTAAARHSRAKQGSSHVGVGALWPHR